MVRNTGYLRDPAALSGRRTIQRQNKNLCVQPLGCLNFGIAKVRLFSDICKQFAKNLCKNIAFRTFVECGCHSLPAVAVSVSTISARPCVLCVLRLSGSLYPRPQNTRFSFDLRGFFCRCGNLYRSHTILQTCAISVRPAGFVCIVAAAALSVRSCFVAETNKIYYSNLFLQLPQKLLRLCNRHRAGLGFHLGGSV